MDSREDTNDFSDCEWFDEIATQIILDIEIIFSI